MILQQECNCNSASPSKFFRTKSNNLLTEQVKTKKKEVGHHDEKSLIRKKEIIELSKELKRFDLSYSILVSQKPKCVSDREKALEIAYFISSDPSAREYFFNKRKIPNKMLSERFDISNLFLKSNRHYLTAMSLLFIGPYAEIKGYFLEEVL